MFWAVARHENIIEESARKEAVRKQKGSCEKLRTGKEKGYYAIWAVVGSGFAFFITHVTW